MAARPRSPSPLLTVGLSVVVGHLEAARGLAGAAAAAEREQAALKLGWEVEETLGTLGYLEGALAQPESTRILAGQIWRAWEVLSRFDEGGGEPERGAVPHGDPHLAEAWRVLGRVGARLDLAAEGHSERRCLATPTEEAVALTKLLAAFLVETYAAAETLARVAATSGGLGSPSAVHALPLGAVLSANRSVRLPGCTVLRGETYRVTRNDPPGPEGREGEIRLEGINNLERLRFEHGAPPQRRGALEGGGTFQGFWYALFDLAGGAGGDA